VIVGQQSAGKSSLLKSLTDIPFPVGDGLCTRFATRIISRRSAPDTSDIVKVSIERGDSEPFDGQSDHQKEPFNPHVPFITAEVFSDIFKQVVSIFSARCS
jgi:GTPase SAR1 family protein